MADRFAGTVRIGGKITHAQKTALLQILEEMRMYDVDELDDFNFQECVCEDFEPLRDYCIAQNIPLTVEWFGHYDQQAYVEYYINGAESVFECNASSEIVITESYLQERQHMFVKDVLDGLGIPDFPALEPEEQPSL